jgi:hypothetical protein
MPFPTLGFGPMTFPHFLASDMIRTNPTQRSASFAPDKNQGKSL